MEGSKVMFALLGIVALCSLVAIIISAITLSRPTQVPTINLSGLGGGSAQPVVVGGSGSCSDGSNSGNTFRIAIGHDLGAHEYIDEKGYLQGYTKELVAEVCQAAGIRCILIWDKYPNCWTSSPGEHSQGGKGLMGNWYDACPGWWITIGRTFVFDFSEPYLKAPTDEFFVRHDDTFDPDNIRDNDKIGFLDGWAQDEKCLARFNTTLKKKQVLYYVTTELIIKALLVDKEIKAFFSTVDVFQSYVDKGDIARVGFSAHCTLGGGSLMAQKGNPIVGHFNRGLSIIRTNGRYHRLCEEAWTRHGHKGGSGNRFNCLE